MRAETVRDALLSRRPFRITMADGRTFDVPHVEVAAMSQSGRVLYLGLENDKLLALDVMLITTLEREGSLPQEKE